MYGQKQEFSSESIEIWLTQRLSEIAAIDAAYIERDDSFSNFGLNSADAIRVAAELEAWIGFPTRPTLLYEFPTIASLSEYLATPQAKHDAQAETIYQPTRHTEPLAIVGMACRFPGAEDITSFWENLKVGIDSIIEVPKSRWDLNTYFSPNAGMPGKTIAKWGGFLSDVKSFDPTFFGITSREVLKMDPQQRLLLELAWEASEDAGFDLTDKSNSYTGVYVGISTQDYLIQQLRDERSIDGLSSTGSALSIAANRISYQWNLRGPSIAIDTACSSSLVALHLARQALQSGECDAAMVGGANIMLNPYLSIAFTKSGVMSPNGRCHAFDIGANGYVRGEGGGMLIVKPLSRALQSNDRIYALIAGSAVNSDGKSNGLLAPNRQAQELLLRKSYREAEVEPSEVTFVEAHGTGTMLGDQVEALALGSVLSEGRFPQEKCLIGSVKTNIGHLEAAAGVAGVIKTALSLYHSTVPKSLHFTQPSPHIPFEDLRLEVCHETKPLPTADKSPVAGVSSFGFGGTNAHVILKATRSIPQKASPPEQRETLIVFSAHSQSQLLEQANRLLRMLKHNALGTNDLRLEDLAYTLNERRSHQDYRFAVTAANLNTLEGALVDLLQNNAAQRSIRKARSGRKPPLAFIFSGHGSHWLEMGLELASEEELFSKMLASVDEVLQPYLNVSIFHALKDPSSLDRIELVQPLIFAIQVAMTRLLQSWDIEPDAVIGHSMGEVTAAWAAGALDLEDAAKLMVIRSRLLAQTSGQGAMLVAQLSRQEAEELLYRYGIESNIAASNSPTSTVLTGPQAELEALKSQLESMEIRSWFIRINAASHSPAVEAILPEYKSKIASIPFREPIKLFYSTMLGGSLGDIPLDSTYWCRNMREPVLFAPALRALFQDGFSRLIEVSPHPILVPSVLEIAEERANNALILGTLCREEPQRRTLLQTLGALHMDGWPLNFSPLTSEDARLISLPNYPFDRRELWSFPNVPANAPHPAKDIVDLASPNRGVLFQSYINLDQAKYAYLGDHRVNDRTIVPMAYYIDVLLQAALSSGLKAPIRLTEFEIFEALELKVGVLVDLQVFMKPLGRENSGFTIELYARSALSRDRWVAIGRGFLYAEGVPDWISAIPQITTESRSIDVAELYEQFYKAGLAYGPSFQNLQVVGFQEDGQTIAQVAHSPVSTEDAYREDTPFYPPLLDSGFQALAPLFVNEGSHYAPLPTKIEELWFLKTPKQGLTVRGQRASDTALLAANLFVTDTISEEPLLVIQGLELTPQTGLQEAACHPKHKLHLFSLKWVAKALPKLDALVTPPVGVVITDSLEYISETLALRTWPIILLSHTEPAELNARIYVAPPDDVYQLRKVLHRLREYINEFSHVVFVPSQSPTSSRQAEVSAEATANIQSLCTLAQSLVLENLLARLWVLTERGQYIAESDTRELFSHSLDKAPIGGVIATLAHEHPELRATWIDVDTSDKVGIDTLLSELRVDDSQREIAYRSGQRLIPYVDTASPRPNPIQYLKGSDSNPAFELRSNAPGLIDELALFEISRKPPASNEVEIHVQAAGINYMDVMNALGLLPAMPAEPTPFGLECAGTVVHVGSEVRDFKAGDEVVALGRSCLGNYVRANAALTQLKPKNLGFEASAALPVAYITASYALEALAQVAPGEKVLIHAATGGVGLAAIEVAKQRGATIYATAGSEKKRRFLRELGIEYISDSRSDAFVEDFLQATNGQGVDVLLNSLSGNLMRAGFRVLAPYGRFIELGKRDIYRNTPIGLWDFQKNLSYFGVDLSRMSYERPELCSKLLKNVIERLELGTLPGHLPYKTYPWNQTQEAFRFISRAQHIGKVVLTSQISNSSPSIVPKSPAISSEGSYVITGAFGGIGMALCEQLLERDAGHLWLGTRRAPREEEAQRIETLINRYGPRIELLSLDVTRPQQTNDAIDTLASNPKPLKGVFHLAGVLDDAALANLTPHQIEKVLAPKIQGAWNLHQATDGLHLDFFVLFSSLSAVLGSPGQAHYAAGNRFMDSLAQFRRAKGLAGQSIGWGPWGEVGMVQGERATNMRRLGMRLMDVAEGLEIFEHILVGRQPYVAVFPTRSEPNMPKPHNQGPLSDFLSQCFTPSPTKLEASTTTKISSPRELVDFLQTEIAKMLDRSPSDIPKDLPLVQAGLDSLTAVELKNRVEMNLDVVLPMGLLIRGPSIDELATEISERLLLTKEWDKT